MSRMSALEELEKAADTLPPDQKQELMLFLAARLRTQGGRLPEPRQYSAEEIEGWIAEDDADWKKLIAGA